MLLYRYKYLPTGQYLFQMYEKVPASLTKSGRIYQKPLRPFVPPLLLGHEIQTSMEDWEEETVEVKVVKRTKVK